MDAQSSRIPTTHARRQSMGPAIMLGRQTSSSSSLSSSSGRYPNSVVSNTSHGTNSKTDVNNTTYQLDSLRRIAESREKELLSLREFSKLECDQLRGQLTHANTVKVSLEEENLQLQQQLSDVINNTTANHHVNNENSNSNTSKIDTYMLQVQAAQSKGGYELLKRVCLDNYSSNTYQRRRMAADADRVIRLVG